MADFNPNELVIEKVRAVEEYDPETKELLGRYTQIEDPSLQVTADGTDVTDAMGAPITTFYNAQSGTFGFSNSLFSLDLAASQFGTKKKVASSEDKIIVPVSETITIGSDHTAVLKYVPVGTKGAEIKFVKVINGDNTFGKTYELSSTANAGKFTLDAATKKITLPEDVTGRVFVNYDMESEKAAMVTKSADSIPQIKSLLIHVIFHDPCNVNNVIAGVISCPRAQVDPSSIEISLAKDGKHAVSYLLRKGYCDESGRLFDIICSQD